MTKVEPRALGVALSYIFVSAYKTFRALRKVCDPSEPWGQHGLVFSRMLFENFVTARWIALNPDERANRFVQFEHITEVQSAFVQGQLSDNFLNQGQQLPADVERRWKRDVFFQVLPQYRKPQNVRCKKDVLTLRWTDCGMPRMLKDLDDASLSKDYELLCTFANSVIHTTPFAGRANVTDDLKFRFEPDFILAEVALSSGMQYLHKLAVFLEPHLKLGLIEPLQRELAEFLEVNSSLLS